MRVPCKIYIYSIDFLHTYTRTQFGSSRIQFTQSWLLEAAAGYLRVDSFDKSPFLRAPRLRFTCGFAIPAASLRIWKIWHTPMHCLPFIYVYTHTFNRIIISTYLNTVLIVQTINVVNCTGIPNDQRAHSQPSRTGNGPSNANYTYGKMFIHF